MSETTSIWPLSLGYSKKAAARRSDGHEWRNLILVLEATLNDPRTGSASGLGTTSTIKLGRRQRAAATTDFPTRTGVAQGHQRFGRLRLHGLLPASAQVIGAGSWLRVIAVARGLPLDRARDGHARGSGGRVCV
jgi:hypothetical protein